MTVQHRPPPGKYRLTVEDFLRLDETGVFGTDRTELLDGDVIIMNAEYRPHGRIAGELQYAFRRVLETIGSDLHAMSASIRLSAHDMPLPDIVLTREPHGAGPIPVESVGLIVEVASSTLDRDMGQKVLIYARAGIPEYWIVDVNGRVVHQLWSSQSDSYDHHRTTPCGARVTAETIEGLAIDTTSL